MRKGIVTIISRITLIGFGLFIIFVAYLFVQQALDSGSFASNRPPAGWCEQSDAYYQNARAQYCQPAQTAWSSWDLKTEVATWTLCLTPIFALLVGMMAAWRFLVVPARNERRELRPDPITGIFPLIEENVTPFYLRLLGYKRIAIHDPNLAMVPDSVITFTPAGKVAVEASMHGIPVEAQVALANRFLAVQARAGGRGLTVGEGRFYAGVFDKEAEYKGLRAQSEQLRLQHLQGRQPPALDNRHTEPQWSLVQAIMRSFDAEEVYLGQARDLYGDVASWNPAQTNMLGLYGGNNTGKTSLANLIALVLAHWGWWVTICDGKNAGDWDDFTTIAQVQPMNAENAVDLLRIQHDEYQRRKFAFDAEGRIRKWQELPAHLAPHFPPYVTILEEYGKIRTQLGRSRVALRQFDEYVDVLAQEARYTGWCGIFMDQRPDNYSNIVKGNINAQCVFRLGAGQGAAVQAYQAHLLHKPGEFEMEGNRYFAFHGPDVLANTLKSEAVRNWSLPVQDGSKPVREEPEPLEDEPIEEAPTPTNSANTNTFQGVSEGEKAPTLPPSVVRAWESKHRWDEPAIKFFAAYPAATMSDWARAMASLTNDGRGYRSFMGGEASDTFHAYSPLGNRSKERAQKRLAAFLQKTGRQDAPGTSISEEPTPRGGVDVLSPLQPVTANRILEENERDFAYDASSPLTLLEQLRQAYGDNVSLADTGERLGLDRARQPLNGANK